MAHTFCLFILCSAFSACVALLFPTHCLPLPLSPPTTPLPPCPLPSQPPHLICFHPNDLPTSNCFTAIHYRSLRSLRDLPACRWLWNLSARGDAVACHVGGFIAFSRASQRRHISKHSRPRTRCSAGFQRRASSRRLRLLLPSSLSTSTSTFLFPRHVSAYCAAHAGWRDAYPSLTHCGRRLPSPDHIAVGLDECHGT